MPQPTIDQLRNAGSLDSVDDLLAVLISGQAPDGSRFTLPTTPASVSKGYQQVALVANVAALLVPPAGATKALITPSADVRWRDDGAVPTAAVGYPTKAGAELNYDADLLAGLRLCSGVAANLDIFYYA